MIRQEFEAMLKEFQSEGMLQHDDSNTYEKYFDKLKKVDSGLDVDKHRWYETSTTVYLVDEEWYMGVDEVTSVFSESMGIDDCGVVPVFFEMEAVASIAYKPIKVQAKE